MSSGSGRSSLSPNGEQAKRNTMSEDGRIWWVKKGDGATYGPVDLAKLCAWAQSGRIAPDDEVSSDGEGWAPAPGMTELEMDWLIEFPGGETFGPLHRQVIEDMSKDGTLEDGTHMVHRSTGQRRLLETGPAAPGAAPDEGAGGAQPPSFKTLAQERDQWEREAQRWKRLYEEEHSQSRQAEQEAADRQRALRDEALALRAGLEAAQRDVERLQQFQAEAGDASGDAALVQAYHEMSRGFETLSRNYSAKLAEIQNSQDRVEEAHRDYEERIRYLDDQLRREREEANAARRRLAEFEESYLTVVHSLREMNDRYIRVREKAGPSAEELASGASRPPAPSHEPLAPAAARSGDESAPGQPLPKGFEPKRQGGPRIRLR